MTERTQSKIKFVGLHAHSVAGSILMGWASRRSTWSSHTPMDQMRLP
jgi:hypothetical protein